MASKHQTALFEDDLRNLVLWHMWFWKKKTSVNSIPPQEKVTIRNGTCWLDLGWLVNCALEWWVKIHSFKMMVGCLWEEYMKHTETVVLYPQWNLVAVAWLCEVQCRTEELGFSLHGKATSTRMAIWIFSGTLPFPQHIFWDMEITLFSKMMVPNATELTCQAVEIWPKHALSGMTTTESWSQSHWKFVERPWRSS